MDQTRRLFIAGSIATGAGIQLLPFAVRAASHSSDVFQTPAGDITVHPVSHASFVMETPVGVIYCDPVGGAGLYNNFPKADLILVTHEHGDHFNAETLQGVAKDSTKIITNPAVFSKLPTGLAARSLQIANGEATDFNSLGVKAIPAYNLTAERQKFHPKGRDNGYVLNFEGFRTYISGDTEDIPDMRALKGIDLAFVCMNLPFTMDIAAAASAIAEFAPRFVYPYHYRGRDGGTQDPQAFAQLVAGVADVKLANWY